MGRILFPSRQQDRSDTRARRNSKTTSEKYSALRQRARHIVKIESSDVPCVSSSFFRGCCAHGKAVSVCLPVQDHHPFSAKQQGKKSASTQSPPLPKARTPPTALPRHWHHRRPPGLVVCIVYSRPLPLPGFAHVSALCLSVASKQNPTTPRTHPSGFAYRRRSRSLRCAPSLC